MDPACPEARAVRPFDHADIVEASGLARSNKQNCVFWVHNDSGADPVLYAIDGVGTDWGEARLGLSATDWEDVASFTLDGQPYLLIADTGNNALDRSEVALLILAEPAFAGPNGSIDIPSTDVIVVDVHYPGQPFDIESIAVDPESDEILVVSKGILATAPADPSGPNQALYSMSLSMAMRNHEVTLGFERLLPGIRPGPGASPADEHEYGIGSGRTTGMDLHPERSEVAILTYREVLLWPRAEAQSWADALGGIPRAVAVPPPGNEQMEGITYTHDGTLLMVADERGNGSSEFTIVRV